jgi:hypothetical protein
MCEEAGRSRRRLLIDSCLGRCSTIGQSSNGRDGGDGRDLKKSRWGGKAEISKTESVLKMQNNIPGPGMQLLLLFLLQIFTSRLGVTVTKGKVRAEIRLCRALLAKTHAACAVRL